MNRPQATSLIELLATLLLISVTGAILTQLFGMGLRVREHTRRIESTHVARVRVRERLSQALENGWPVKTPQGLLCRSALGDTTFALRNNTLVAEQGSVETPLASYVQQLTFTIERDVAEHPRGVSYTLLIQPPDGGAAQRWRGFVVQRLELEP